MLVPLLNVACWPKTNPEVSITAVNNVKTRMEGA
jgi:hypothetical protein